MVFSIWVSPRGMVRWLVSPCPSERRYSRDLENADYFLTEGRRWKKTKGSRHLVKTHLIRKLVTDPISAKIKQNIRDREQDRKIAHVPETWPHPNFYAWNLSVEIVLVLDFMIFMRKAFRFLSAWMLDFWRVQGDIMISSWHPHENQNQDVLYDSRRMDSPWWICTSSQKEAVDVRGWPCSSESHCWGFEESHHLESRII